LDVEGVENQSEENQLAEEVAPLLVEVAGRQWNR
jgi:hypothetical protein